MEWFFESISSILSPVSIHEYSFTDDGERERRTEEDDDKDERERRTEEEDDEDERERRTEQRGRRTEEEDDEDEGRAKQGGRRTELGGRRTEEEDERERTEQGGRTEEDGERERRTELRGRRAEKEDERERRTEVEVSQKGDILRREPRKAPSPLNPARHNSVPRQEEREREKERERERQKEKEKEKERERQREKEKEKERVREKEREEKERERERVREKEEEEEREREKERVREKEREKQKQKEREREREREREKEKEREREREKEKEREKEREREREREVQKQKEIEREREREKEKEREREREKEREREGEREDEEEWPFSKNDRPFSVANPSNHIASPDRRKVENCIPKREVNPEPIISQRSWSQSQPQPQPQPRRSEAQPAPTTIRTPLEVAKPVVSSQEPVASIESVVRIHRKTKGYFDLAKIEIEKAIRRDEVGMKKEAMVHYVNASSILTEGLALPFTPNSSSFSQEIKKYREKMEKLRKSVADRSRSLKNSMGILPKASVQRQASSNRIAPSQSFRAVNTLKPMAPNTQSPNISSDACCSSSPEDMPKGIDPKIAEEIENQIIDRSPTVTLDSIAGLEKAKDALKEMVILPLRRSDLFIGLRKPARGLLLFGPPGTGKTLLGKAVASESSATFFSISASTLTSKWVGEGEKRVRALFAIARFRQPSVIFIDEIDSIMSSRSGDEHEASRRLKSEFLVQFDGVITSDDDRVVIIGATNRPYEIDDAVRRRLVKRIYIPLPDLEARKSLFSKILKGRHFSIPENDIMELAKATKGYSGSDLRALCSEAAMAPIREIQNIDTIAASQVRPLRYSDFKLGMNVIRPSISREQLRQLEEWNEEFGSK